MADRVPRLRHRRQRDHGASSDPASVCCSGTGCRVRTRETVTDGLGLVTLLIGGLAAAEVTAPVLAGVVGEAAPVLIVLGVGADRRDRRLAGRHRGAGSTGWGTGCADCSHRRSRPGAEGAESDPARERFVEGFVTASLVFCVGPLTILGALSDGLGLGADQLILKATLDGFAAIAFAASLGVGVMASAVTVAVIQGPLTLVGFLLGDFLPAAHLAAITAAGGLLLIGVGLRLLRIRMVPVGNLLPALLVAPLLVLCRRPR